MSDGAAKQKASTGFHFLAGLTSGCTSAFLLQPADLLKTRIQQSRSATLTSVLRSVLAGPQPLQQLWRGTTPSVIRTGFGSALYFGMLNQLRSHAAALPATIGGSGNTTTTTTNNNKSDSSALPKLGNLANLSTGAAARVAAGFIMNPVTVLKVRYESSYYNYTTLAGAGRDVLGREGLRGFFAGFGATAVRDAPYAGLYVLVYENAKARLGAVRAVEGEGGDGDDGGKKAKARSTTTVYGAASVNFASGVVAAVAATTLTNPFDAIKTRLQIMPRKYANMVQGAKLMLKEEGLRSMFDGLSLRIGRKAVSSALAWTVYEELIRRAERRLV
ncbi:hypothetical protein MBLNU230_g1119t1 [Neophaeotheca triangularis]